MESLLESLDAVLEEVQWVIDENKEVVDFYKECKADWDENAVACIKEQEKFENRRDNLLFIKELVKNYIHDNQTTD